jgi:asparagine synthase (glutamine-hydrolysing)
MSIIFGTCKPRGEQTAQQEMQRLATPTNRYAADGTFIAVRGQIGMGFQPYHTHARSQVENQPVVDASGNMLVFDGRLDNWEDLRRTLDIRDHDIPDSTIVLAAFLHWGEHCFHKLIGDWALVLWSAADHLIYLARDHAGTRTLYFKNDDGILRWSTYLDTFFVGGETYSVDEDYAARYLCCQPVFDFTPYGGIRAVPPAHYLVVQGERITRQRHWDWIAKERILYKSEEEYGEHFLALLRQSVERRDGPGAPIVAQLSGGMDSSSIVCTSDHIRSARGASSTDLIDTVSYYDDTEPNWDETPYFLKVEAERHKVGIHIATSFLDRTFEWTDSSRGHYLLPGPDSSSLDQEKKINEALGPKNYRVVISGIGGDEVLGGVPTALPELADHLTSWNFSQLFSQAKEWCLVDRRPMIHMLLETIAFTASLSHQPYPDKKKLPPWIKPHLQNRCTQERQSIRTDVKQRRVLPSAISNGLNWWSVMETLPHVHPAIFTRYEHRYPYLDRDLVDFLFRVPRQQIIRPGRRRYLMRRALVGIVPTEILERRRKAFLVRGPLAVLQKSERTIRALFSNLLAADRGFIDPGQLRSAFDLTICNGDPKWTRPILMTIAFELWLRSGARALQGYKSRIF